MARPIIQVEVQIDAPAAQVWQFLTRPEDIRQWHYALDSWHTPRVDNDLRPGGAFSYRMQAKDGSAGFDFSGVYDAVCAPRHIAYTLDDGRKVDIRLKEENGRTRLIETFEAEADNPLPMQEQGWQAILDNLKKYIQSSPSKPMDGESNG